MKKNSADVLRDLNIRAKQMREDIMEASIMSTGSLEEEWRLNNLYHDLALVEEQLNVTASLTEVLDNSFDELDESDYNLLRGVANEND